MFQNFHVDLTPTATGNGSQSAKVVILKREYVIAVCL
jgi:hypothetical protein